MYDKYCIDAADLDSARARLEAVLPISLVLHESMFWGGDYYRFESDEFGEVTIRRNQNSYIDGLNEPDHPDCQLVVSVSESRNPEAIEARLVAGGLRLLDRSVLEDGIEMSTPITHLIPVGFYSELRGGKPHEPSLRAAVQPSASADEARVIEYLNAGETLIATAGSVSDILDPKFGVIGAPHVLTDGTYAWPAILAHYVERHHVRLPDEFMTHMRDNAWTVPHGIDLVSLKLDRNVPSL